MKATLFVSSVLLSVLAVVGSGCATQRVLSMQDHRSLPLTKVETLRTKKLLFWPMSAEHQFWLCKDEGESLKCDLECGGSNDLACPVGVIAGGTSTSNVQ